MAWMEPKPPFPCTSPIFPELISPHIPHRHPAETSDFPADACSQASTSWAPAAWMCPPCPETAGAGSLSVQTPPGGVTLPYAPGFLPVSLGSEGIDAADSPPCRWEIYRVGGDLPRVTQVCIGDQRADLHPSSLPLAFDHEGSPAPSHLSRSVLKTLNSGAKSEVPVSRHPTTRTARAELWPRFTWREAKVSQSCPILCNPMDCIVDGILNYNLDGIPG